MSNSSSSFLVLNKIEAEIDVDIFIVRFVGIMVVMIGSQKGEMLWHLFIGCFSDGYFAGLVIFALV